MSRLVGRSKINKTGYRGIDGIMKNEKSGTFAIFEAKGGSSRLKPDQMSKPWIDKRITSIVEKSRNVGASDRERLVNARKSHNLFAMVVRLDLPTHKNGKLELFFQVQKYPKIGSWGPNL